MIVRKILTTWRLTNNLGSHSNLSEGADLLPALTSSHVLCLGSFLDSELCEA